MIKPDGVQRGLVRFTLNLLFNFFCFTVTYTCYCIVKSGSLRKSALKKEQNTPEMFSLCTI